MLPSMFATAKKSVAAAVTATTLVAFAAAPAHAWGQSEQDILKGVFGTLLIQSMIRSSHLDDRRQPQTVYVTPQYTAPTYYNSPATSSYVSYTSTPAAQAFNSYSSNERRRIQSTLAAYGYYHSNIDGAFGPATYNAITAYAQSTGKSDLLATRGGVYSLYDGLLF